MLVKGCFVIMLTLVDTKQQNVHFVWIKQGELQLSGDEEFKLVRCVLQFWEYISTASWTLRLSVVPDIFQVKLYSMLGWTFERHQVSFRLDWLFWRTYQLCSAMIQPHAVKPMNEPWAIFCHMEGKQVSQPVEWESHSFSCCSPTTWVSFPLRALCMWLLQLVTHSGVSVLLLQWKKKLTWL